VLGCRLVATRCVSRAGPVRLRWPARRDYPQWGKRRCSGREPAPALPRPEDTAAESWRTGVPSRLG